MRGRLKTSYGVGFDDFGHGICGLDSDDVVEGSFTILEVVKAYCPKMSVEDIRPRLLLWNANGLCVENDRRHWLMSIFGWCIASRMHFDVFSLPIFTLARDIHCPSTDPVKMCNFQDKYLKYRHSNHKQ